MQTQNGLAVNKKWAFIALMISLLLVVVLAHGSLGVTLSPVQAEKTVDSPRGTPVDFVRAVLPSAVADFAALRGAKITTGLQDSVYAGYKLHVDPQVCSNCHIYDYYAFAGHAEYWSTGNIYWADPAGSGNLVEPKFDTTPSPGASPSTVASAALGAENPPPGAFSSPPPEWPPEKTEAYLKSQFSPLLAGFSLTRSQSPGVTGGAATTLRWRGSRGVWVVADIYPHPVAGLMQVRLVVGHDLTKSVHVVLPPTKAQIAAMQGGVAKMVRAAVSAAPTDFAHFRGPESKSDSLGHIYTVTSTFGPAFRSCDLVDVRARTGKSWTSGSETWAMQCTTVPVLGDRASLETNVVAAINAALPYTYMAEDPKFRDDALWRNTSGIQVAIEWGPQGEGIVSFTVRVSRLAKD